MLDHGETMATTPLIHPTNPDLTRTGIDPQPFAPHARPDVVDRFAARIQAGATEQLAELYAADAVLDATVPNWRFEVEGGDAIAAEYARWFAHVGQFEEFDRFTTPTGAGVRYLLSWIEDDVPHAGHHCHLFDIVDDHITVEHVFCGGRWPASLLAEMAASSER